MLVGLALWSLWLISLVGRVNGIAREFRLPVKLHKVFMSDASTFD